MQSTSTHRADSEVENDRRHLTGTRARWTEKMRNNKGSLKSAALFAAPSVLLVVLVASSAYTSQFIVDQLDSLHARIGQLEEATGRDVATIGDSNGQALAYGAQIPTGANGSSLDAEVGHLQQIEGQLKALTENVNLLSAQLDSFSQAKVNTTATVPPPLPPMQPPGFAIAQDAPPKKEAGWEPAIAAESRVEASQILREYAEQARFEIEAMQEAGTFDQAAMERIKRDTRMQAASELRDRLPLDVYEEMFPTELEAPPM